jgi:hypothetical protein
MSISGRCFSLNIKQLYTLLIFLLLFFITRLFSGLSHKYFFKKKKRVFINHKMPRILSIYYYLLVFSPPPPPPPTPPNFIPPQTPCPFYSHLVHIISPAQLACLRTILAIYGQIFHTLPFFNRLAGQNLLYATTPSIIPYTYYLY